mgnify:CR=1 FL=1
MKTETKMKKNRQDVKDYIATIAGVAVTMLVITAVVSVPVKLIEWSNCQDVCEANGDEPFWRIRLGCFCEDSDGLYNPHDERQR